MLEVYWFSLAQLSVSQLFGSRCDEFNVREYVLWFEVSLSLHFQGLHDSVLIDWQLGLVECNDAVAEDRHQFALDWLGWPLISALCLNPDVAVRAENAAYRGLGKELEHVTLHSSD